MYEFSTHRIWSSVVLSPALMAGIATLTIVVSSMIMKNPVVKTASTSHGLVRAWDMPAYNLTWSGLIPRLAAERLFKPGDVPIAPEFAALLGKKGDPLEAETLVQG